MLSSVTAVRFDRVLTSGRTRPCLVGCETEDGQEIEVVVKLAAGCDLGVRSLMAEAVAAMLAADLDLPVPEPFLVMLETDFANLIANPDAKRLATQSIGWNFGSKKLPPGYVTYPAGKSLPLSLIPTATEILAFDVFIGNPDRRTDNPNLLLRGEEMAIYDHELAFFTEGVIGWKPPWHPGGIAVQRHVLLAVLKGKKLDLARLTGAFQSLTDARLTEYRQALPATWVGDGVAVDKTFAYLRDLRDNIQEAVMQLIGALQ